MTPDPREIAGRLTTAQAEALRRAEPDGNLGLYFARWWRSNGRTLRALRKHGLGTAVWSGVALNALGLAVRDVLMEEG